MPIDVKRVEKPTKKLRKILKSNSRQPSQEEVHNLRTNIRRVEATVSALSLDRSRNRKRVLKDLSKVRKRAGKVRDMDVLTGFAASLNAEGDQDCKVQLLEYLGARRRRMARKLHSQIRKDRRTLRRRLKNATAELDRLAKPRNPEDSQPALAQATATAIAMQAELTRTPRHLGRQNLHPYRLKVKELRNVLRMAERNAGSEFVAALGQVKDAIGEWHDWQDLLATAEEILDNGSSCNVLRELRTRVNDKYEYALRSAETLRRKYLQESRDGLKKSGKLPHKSVSIAIAGMAA